MKTDRLAAEENLSAAFFIERNALKRFLHNLITRDH
jgi:hypothetical protein